MDHRRRPRLVVLLTALFGLASTAMAFSTPPASADDEAALNVHISTLTPTTFDTDDDLPVTMTGTITNNDSQTWSAVQAYLVIPTTPFTTRAQMTEVLASGNVYTGRRITESGTFDEVGDLQPGESTSFRISVPQKTLGISGAEGIYPVGVQLLATNAEGHRSDISVARATTFLPLISTPAVPKIAAGIGWPFLMPTHRDQSGNYADAEELYASVGPDGQLRNLLDLARSMPPLSGTIVLDPALLVAVDDLAHRRRVSQEVDDASATAAQRFLDDLIDFAQNENSWILDYLRPDTLSLAANPDIAPMLREPVDTATSMTLAAYQVTGRRVEWPTKSGVNRQLLESIRSIGDEPVIVSSSELPKWQRRLGSLVQYNTDSGPVPLLVDDVLDAGVPGQDSVVNLRQRIVAEAALAALQQGIDPESRADAVVLVKPNWNPGRDWQASGLASAFQVPYITRTTFNNLLTGKLEAYPGQIGTRASSSSLSRNHLEAVMSFDAVADVFRSISPEDEVLTSSLVRDVAGMLSVQWRNHRSEASDIVMNRRQNRERQLEKVTVEGPSAVTLSSTTGRFPITISNASKMPVTVGVTLESTNPALTVPPIEPIHIGSGERRTTNVDINVGQQNSATLTAQLTSPNGIQFGKPAVFNVRSSNVGTAIWVSMGVAAAAVIFAMVRRFSRRNTSGLSPRGEEDDD